MSEEPEENDSSTSTKQKSNKKPERRRLSYEISDPQELIHQLETTTLDPEDTEDLLLDAYKMNMMLKEIIRTQNTGSMKSKRGRRVDLPPINPRHLSTGLPSIYKKPQPKGRAKLSKVNSKDGKPSGIPKIKVIGPGSKHCSLGSQSPRQKPKGLVNQCNRSPGFRGGSPNSRVKLSSSLQGRRRAKSVSSRPAWDDRFSFS